ncbi:MAG: hypothetical protein ACKVQU_09265 [Burkholderiales bacterium]
MNFRQSLNVLAAASVAIAASVSQVADYRWLNSRKVELGRSK